MRLAAQPVPLSFGPFTAQVVIKRFTASYERNGFWIPYSIVCEVLPPAPGADAVGSTALAGLIGRDVTSALDSVSAAAGQIAGVATIAVMQASSVLAQMTPVSMAAAINLGGVTAALTTGTAILAGVTDIAQSPGTAAQAAAQFQSAIAAIDQAASVVGAGLSGIGVRRRQRRWATRSPASTT